MKPGDKVHYIPYKGCDEKLYENGIIKEIVSPKKARIVYHCGNDWDHYMNYTSSLSNIDRLREGWIDRHDYGDSEPLFQYLL